jgi:hypothetical protein
MSLRLPSVEFETDVCQLNNKTKGLKVQAPKRVLMGYFAGDLEEAQFAGADYRLSAAVGIQLAVDILKMLVDRLAGDDKTFCDLLIGAALCQKPKHFHFAPA